MPNSYILNDTTKNIGDGLAWLSPELELELELELIYFT